MMITIIGKDANKNAHSLLMEMQNGTVWSFFKKVT